MTTNRNENNKFKVFRTRYVPTLWPIITYCSWDISGLFGVDRGSTLNVWNKGYTTLYCDIKSIEEI